MDMNNTNSKTKKGIMVSIVLSVIGIGFIVSNLIHVIPAGDTSAILHNCINCFLLILSLNYVLIGYKKPHGNLLRATLFIFALCLVVQNGISGAGELVMVSNIASGIAAMMISYTAGRLDKLEKNNTVLTAAGVLLLIQWVLLLMGDDFILGKTIGRCTPMIVLAGLGFAYTARYEAHKAAGKENV